MQRTVKLAIVLLAILGGVGSALGQQPTEHTKDDIAIIRARVTERKAALVDVREQPEGQAGHLKDAQLLPLSQITAGLEATKLAKDLPKDKPVYLYCASARRCLTAAKILKELGYDARPLKLGFMGRIEAGFPEAQKN